LSIIAAISLGQTNLPMPFWLISQFWQKTQRRLHPLKNIVPEPCRPRRGSSSP